MKKTKQQKRVETLISRAAEIKLVLEKYKDMYRELDNIVMELVELEVMQANAPGLQMSIIDNFAEKNTAFRIARINRYEIKVDPIAMPIRDLKRKIKKSDWDFPTAKKKRA